MIFLLLFQYYLALAIEKIFTTSFTIGAGGSGDIFGKLFNQVMQNIVTEPGAFVIVGMAGFFRAVSNMPISTIIFVNEMTKSYHLLLPSLLVCSVSYLLAQKWSIYEKQVINRIDSPTHSGEFIVDILQAIKSW